MSYLPRQKCSDYTELSFASRWQPNPKSVLQHLASKKTRACSQQWAFVHLVGITIQYGEPQRCIQDQTCGVNAAQATLWKPWTAWSHCRIDDYLACYVALTKSTFSGNKISVHSSARAVHPVGYTTTRRISIPNLDVPGHLGDIEIFCCCVTLHLLSARKVTSVATSPSISKPLVERL